MPTLHIPAVLFHLSNNEKEIIVEGNNLRAIFRKVSELYPDLVDRIIQDDSLRPDIAVAIDGTILEDGNLIQPLAPDAQIYLVPPIGGG